MAADVVDVFPIYLKAALGRIRTEGEELGLGVLLRGRHPRIDRHSGRSLHGDRALQTSLRRLPNYRFVNAGNELTARLVFKTFDRLLTRGLVNEVPRGSYRFR
jgi:hypothetical protein